MGILSPRSFGAEFPGPHVSHMCDMLPPATAKQVVAKLVKQLKQQHQLMTILKKERKWVSCAIQAQGFEDILDTRVT